MEVLHKKVWCPRCRKYVFPEYTCKKHYYTTGLGNREYCSECGKWLENWNCCPFCGEKFPKDLRKYQHKCEVGPIETLIYTNEEIEVECRQWLDTWTYGSANIRMEVPSQAIVNYLSKFRPSKPVVLYRGIPKEGVATEHLKKLKSYTYSYEMAKTIACKDDTDKTPEECSGRVERRLVHPNEILVDFTKLPNSSEYLNEVVVIK